MKDNCLSIHISPKHQSHWQKLIDDLNRQEVVRKLFAEDPSLFKNRKPLMFGWLNEPKEQLKSLASLQKMQAKAMQQGFSAVVLLGMGGSSMAARVFKQCLSKADALPFVVLDTIHPAALKRLEDDIDITKALFIVASKSGTTLEPNILYHHFNDRLIERKVSCTASHFMAISDPLSDLEKLSVEQGFLQGPFGNEDIGGRYSALSAFGIMPALFMGIDAEKLLQQAKDMAERCATHHDVKDNPGAMLGAFLGFNGLIDHNLLNFHFSKELAPFGAWLEQLIAESLGKDGRGLVPIVNPPSPDPKPHRSMHCFMGKSGDKALGQKMLALKNEQASFVSIEIDNVMDLGALMFMWEIATSLTGAIIDVNPFDQPNVEKSKVAARAFMNKISTESPSSNTSNSPLAVFEAEELKNPNVALENFVRSCNACAFGAILSFLDETPDIEERLLKLGQRLGERLSVPMLVQNGPRYLHSTGQLFKGGKNDGCFLMLTGPYYCNYPSEFPGLGFKDIQLSQALGDMAAMQEAQRRIVRVNLFDIKDGFAELFKII